jgi:hypothetical protein
MITHRHHYQTPLQLGLKGLLIALLTLALLAGWLPTALDAAPAAQEQPAAEPLRATRVNGALSNQYSAHYLGLQPAQRDGTVVLTLSYDPQDASLAGLVNFIVLTEDGLRRFLAGEDPTDLDVAAGSPLQFGSARNRLQGALKDSGRGNYTVIVYNESTTPITYDLLAQNGILLDSAGQTVADAADVVAMPAPTPTPNPSLVPAAVRARRVSGDLDGQLERHYLALAPDVVDGQVRLQMDYEPTDQAALRGATNFWVLDSDGVRRLIQGIDPEEVNVATGFPPPFDNTPGRLEATYTASGNSEYTAVLYNVANIPSRYVLGVTGGLLIDRYGQTNESIAAAAESAALASAPEAVAAATAPTTASAATTAASAPVAATPATTGEGALIPASTTETPVRPTKLAGQLSGAYQQHYLGLFPDVRNGAVTLLLDFDPKNSEALANNINFWVLDQDALRRVVAGARPEDLDMASGALVRFGAEKGMLRGDFNASGRSEYTVIVFNNSDVPASYTLKAIGATLQDDIGQTQPVP